VTRPTSNLKAAVITAALPMLQSEELQKRIDGLYQSAFTHEQSNGTGSGANNDHASVHEATTGLTEEAFGRLGRTQPQVEPHC